MFHEHIKVLGFFPPRHIKSSNKCKFEKRLLIGVKMPLQTIGIPITSDHGQCLFAVSVRKSIFSGKQKQVAECLIFVPLSSHI